MNYCLVFFLNEILVLAFTDDIQKDHESWPICISFINLFKILIELILYSGHLLKC